jgi:hypothetical protein
LEQIRLAIVIEKISSKSFKTDKISSTYCNETAQIEEFS